MAGNPNLKFPSIMPPSKGTPVKPTAPYFKNLTNVKGKVSPKFNRKKAVTKLLKKGKLTSNHS